MFVELVSRDRLKAEFKKVLVALYRRRKKPLKRFIPVKSCREKVFQVLKRNPSRIEYGVIDEVMDDMRYFRGYKQGIAGYLPRRRSDAGEKYG